MLPWCANDIIIDGHESVLVKLLRLVLDEQGKPNLELILPEPSPRSPMLPRAIAGVSNNGGLRASTTTAGVSNGARPGTHLRGLSQSTPPTKIVETLAQSHPELRVWLLTNTPDWAMASRQCFQGGESVYFSAPDEGAYDAWFEREDSLGLEA